MALGNAAYSEESVRLLNARYGAVSDMVDRHIEWALARQKEKQLAQNKDVENRQQQRLIRAVEKGLPRDA